MAWREELTTLTELLAELYPSVETSRRVVAFAGLKPALISFNSAAALNWHSILETAERHQQVHEIVKVALEDYPENALLAAYANSEPRPIEGPDIGTIPWRGDLAGDRLEKIIGAQSTILPISFLEVGLRVSRAVGRIVLSDGASGTGFLIGGNVVLTNHHVLPEIKVASGATIDFNYQKTADGLDSPVRRWPLLPLTKFATCEEHDWTAVAVDAEAENQWGSIPLPPAVPKVGDFVSIIQHPGGGPKQIAIFHNTVVFAGKDRIQYLTD